MSSLHKASCLCGAIQFEVENPGEIGHCHCVMCQKAHGAAYGTYVDVHRDHLRIVSGEDAIGRYESSPGIQRTFCKQCGSTLQFYREGADRQGLAAGLFDSELERQPRYEIWTSSSKSWANRDNLELTHRTEPQPGEWTPNND